MDLSELKYIDQDVLDECHLAVTSSDVYREAQEFNAYMLEMQRRRYRFRKEAAAMIFTDLVVVPFGMSGISGRSSLLGHMESRSAAVRLCLLFTLTYAALFCFFFLYKKDYSWKKCLAYSMLLFPASYVNIIAVIANTVLMFFMDKLDRSIRFEPGYPAFPQLHLTFPADLDALEEGEMKDSRDAGRSEDLEYKEEPPEVNPFDKYRIKPENDSGLLCDNDVSLAAGENRK